MGQARARRASLVDQCVDVRKALLPCRIEACVPRDGNGGDLLVAQLGERPYVTWRMDDDLLPVEGRIEVRDDADRPGELPANAEGLGGRSVLAPFAERALVELGLGRLLDRARRRAGTPAPVWGDGYEPPGERVSPKFQRGRGTAGSGRSAPGR
jgi:hypothetical protein